MRRILAMVVGLLTVAGSLLFMVPSVEAGAATGDYGDVSLSGEYQSGHFPELWDLTQGDLTISFTYDGNGLVDEADAHAWSQIGVRTEGYGDFNPTWGSGGAGVWFSADYDHSAGTFDPDPPASPSQDLDDKLMLQKAGDQGEVGYDLPGDPPDPWSNHRFWFDRDGVDQWQADHPLAVDGGTFNTLGTYDIVITLHATDGTHGTAYMTINGLAQGFETDGDWKTMEMSPAGMTFTGDMERMQVFYGLWGYGETHGVEFTDIMVQGYQYWSVMDIDIKPGSDVNPINVRSKGVTPAAILGTDALDVNEIDPATVMLGGAYPLRWAQEDVDDDGHVDLVLHFKTQELTVTATMTMTADTFGGEHLMGTDTVVLKGA